MALEIEREMKRTEGMKMMALLLVLWASGIFIFQG